MLDHRKLLAGPQALIALGVAARIFTYARVEEAAGRSVFGLLVAAALATVLAAAYIGVVTGLFEPFPVIYRGAAAIYLGVAVLITLDQRSTPVTWQIANLGIFIGLASASLVHWYTSTPCFRTRAVESDGGSR